MRAFFKNSEQHAAISAAMMVVAISGGWRNCQERRASLANCPVRLACRNSRKHARLSGRREHPLVRLIYRIPISAPIGRRVRRVASADGISRGGGA